MKEILISCPKCKWIMNVPEDLEKYTRWLCPNCDYNLKYSGSVAHVGRALG